MTGRSDEIAAAFAEFLRRGAHDRDWEDWASVFTDDAVYTEHCLGTFHGADDIRSWIVGAMQPVACMTFSIEWSIIDGDRVAFWIWNHLPDPAGEGREFAFANLSILTYAGAGRWSAEEDLYDPTWAEGPVLSWFAAGGRPDLPADPSLRPAAPAHPVPPAPAPTRPTVEAAVAGLVPPGAPIREQVIEGAVAVVVYDTSERAVGVVAHVDAAGRVVFSQECTNPRERWS